MEKLKQWQPFLLSVFCLAFGFALDVYAPGQKAMICGDYNHANPRHIGGVDGRNPDL
jgi:hypothetical protein